MFDPYFQKFKNYIVKWNKKKIKVQGAFKWSKKEITFLDIDKTG